MNFVSELVEDCSTIPSAAFKEHILALLESNERSMKVLTNVLKIDTVREFVSNYEECHGQVSSDTWEYILRQLGYSEEYFQQPVPADQMTPGATDKLAGIPEDDLEENGGGAQSISRVWPKWSLPPPDESSSKENLVEDAANGDDDHDFSLQAAAGNGPSHRKNIIPSAIQSLSLSVVENERSHHENSTLAEIEGREEILAASSVQADHKQQSIDKTTTPSRPTTPEAPRSTHDPVVTGQNRSRQNNAVAEPYPPGNGEESQERVNPSKTPAENDCTAEIDCIENNNGLYAELQKVYIN